MSAPTVPPATSAAAPLERRRGASGLPNWWVVGLGWLAALALGVCYALWIRHVGGWDGGAPWERATMLRIHAVALPPWANWLLLRTADIGTNRSLFPVCLAAALWLWFRSRRRELALWIAVAEVGGLVLNWAVKTLLPRERPDLWERVGWYGFSHSYPSGHVIASLAVLTTLALVLHRLRGWWWPTALALLVTLVNIFGRMYHGVHWPSDVMGGALVGGVWLLATAIGFDGIPRRRRADGVPPAG
jgi:undecaprenyl-diphosphatase